MKTEIEKDPVIEAYKKDVDRTLLIENLRRTPQQRGEILLAMARLHEEAQKLRRARAEAKMS